MERYYEVFQELLGVHSAVEIEKTAMDETDAWTSFVHLKLITELEQVFGIEFDANDILEFRSFESGIMILERKGIQLR